MKRFIYCLLLALTIRDNIGQSIQDICVICQCENGIVDCKSLKLEACFNKSDWEKVNGKEKITEANFDSNHIGHLIALPPLPSLTKLSFRYNRIVTIDPAAFYNLTALEYLDLSENQLTKAALSPKVFQGPYNPVNLEPLPLKDLDLSGNEIHSLDADVFEHFPKLTHLHLQNNPIKILDFSTVVAISSIPKLEVLDLSYTKIGKLPEHFLHSTNYLKEFVLKGNNFTEVPKEVLSASHNLEILNLNENPIRVISTESGFPLMPSLQQLHISHMPELTRIDDGSLSGLVNLTYLDCKMNAKLEHIGEAALSRSESGTTVWPKITTLDLGDNALVYLDFDLLGPEWSNLKHLNLLGNKWSCDCENQWLVSQAIPLLQSIKSPVSSLLCSAPSEMKGLSLLSLSKRNYTLRCLDYYGNHPENDGTILASIFVIIILLLVIIGLVIWRRNNRCYFRQGGPVNYSRAFYRPADIDEPEKF